MFMFMPQDAVKAIGGTLTGDGTTDNPYQIEDADDLEAFAEKVNGGETTACAILVNDITFNNDVLDENGELNGTGETFRQWTPISQVEDYNGTFDGNGHVIKGLYYSTDEWENFGFFMYIGENGTVKNLGLTDNYISSSSDTGSIAYVNSGNIENCYNAGTISGDYAGGIAYYNKSTITDCYNDGEISGKYIGGIVSENYGTIKDCYNNGTLSGIYVGGIVTNNIGTITNCYNTGTISGYDANGIAFINHGIITNCYNTETINAENASGIVSLNFETIKNCYNTGTINAKNVSGIVGENNGTITDCYNIGTLSGTNTGDIAINNYENCIIKNCYYLADDETDKFDGTTAKTNEQFKNGEVAYLLQGEQKTQVWGQKNVTDAIPQLTDKNKVYCIKDIKCDGTIIEKTYSNTFAEDTTDSCEYDENGFCKKCDGYEPATLNANNVYEISNAGQLYWFAEYVNSGNYSANAILLNDIVINENVLDENGQPVGISEKFRQWTPISQEEENSYNGTFNGNGHAIKGLYYSTDKESNFGFFMYIGENGTVENVGLVDNYINS